ncbi:MAG: glycoside hydrolase domain-containing protein, partial [Victivallaceae bacterium]
GRRKGVTKHDAGYAIAKKNIKNWKMNEWHFVTCSWDEQKLCLYIDGMLADTKNLKYSPETPFTSVVLGGSPKGWNGILSKTLIDDVKIFDAVLSPQEVVQLYSSYNFKKLEADASPLKINKVTGHTDIEKKILKLSFLLSRFQPDFNSYKVNVEILDSAKKVALQQHLTSKGMDYETDINVAALPPGRYKIVIKPVPVGKEQAPVYDLDYAIPTVPAAWDNNQCGISDKVPQPWTDLKILPDNTVECWGRKYVFGKNLFPEQIISGKYSLLEKPVNLVINGKAFTAPCDIKVIKSSASAVELECVGKNDSITVKTRILVEYDGFMWITLDVVPGKSMTVKSMVLNVPMKKDCATLFNLMRKYYFDYEAGFQGTINSKTINADIYQHNPVIWLGNEDVGLEWFAETLKGWHNTVRGQAMQVIPGADSQLLRLNLIDSTVELAQARRIEFGFQATPVRPQPKDWRKLRDDRNIKAWFPWETIHNVPDAEYKKSNYETMRNDYERKYGRVFHYFATYTISPFFPEWLWWGDVWKKVPGEMTGWNTADDREWVGVYDCTNSKSFEDFYAWKFYGAQKTLDMKNIYIDNQCAQRCRNAVHGCGWKDDSGATNDTWNILGTRRLAKRLYAMVKNHNPDGMTIRHMSAQLVMPIISFADIIVDGELYMGPVAKDECYYNIFEPGMFRAAFMSRQFGPPNLFIPQFERAIINHDKSKLAQWKAGKLPDQAQKLRHFKGYFLVHDAKIYPIFGISMNDFWKFEDDFKMTDDTPFFGYWDKENPFKITNCDSEREMLSAYVDHGKFMLIAMNDTGSAKQMNIKIDADKLSKYGVKKIGKLINPETNGEIEINGNAFNLNVKPRDYQILIYQQ